MGNPIEMDDDWKHMGTPMTQKTYGKKQRGTWPFSGLNFGFQGLTGVATGFLAYPAMIWWTHVAYIPRCGKGLNLSLLFW